MLRSTPCTSHRLAPTIAITTAFTVRALRLVDVQRQHSDGCSTSSNTADSEREAKKRPNYNATLRLDECS